MEVSEGTYPGASDWQVDAEAQQPQQEAMWLGGIHITGSLNQFWEVALDKPQG